MRCSAKGASANLYILNHLLPPQIYEQALTPFHRSDNDQAQLAALEDAWGKYNQHLL